MPPQIESLVIEYETFMMVDSERGSGRDVVGIWRAKLNVRVFLLPAGPSLIESKFSPESGRRFFFDHHFSLFVSFHVLAINASTIVGA